MDWWAWMEKHRVKLQPVIDTTKTLWWSAGYVTLSSAGYQNVVRERNYVQAPTPLAALAALKKIRPPRRRQSC
jgi:hypothetical protein